MLTADRRHTAICIAVASDAMTAGAGPEQHGAALRIGGTAGRILVFLLRSGGSQRGEGLGEQRDERYRRA
ncbi:MAG TPA: hypothetical protein VMK82_08495 [Steroidobacteraceae bacterium]|nr:hypothetical protein [Steroidobacteraceae bacterium]